MQDFVHQQYVFIPGPPFHTLNPKPHTSARSRVTAAASMKAAGSKAKAEESCHHAHLPTGFLLGS